MLFQLASTRAKSVHIVGELVDKSFEFVHRIDNMNSVSKGIKIDIETTRQFLCHVLPVGIKEE